MPQPSVSILTPCYQQGTLLREAIESALAQTFGDFEMIIVNDGSTDATREIGEGYAAKDSRIRYLEQPNQGQAAARAKAFDLAQGELVVFLDADDLLEPEMLEACSGACHREEYAGVVAQAMLVDHHGIPIREFEQARVVVWPDILEFNPYGALAALMLKREAIEAVGGLNFPAPPGAEDWDLWARMARCGMHLNPFNFVAARYRQTIGSWSRRVLPMLESAVAVVNFAAREDERLKNSPHPPAGPISKSDHARLVNGRVFHALGMAAFENVGDEELRQVLDYLTAGKMDLAYCREMFLWGCQASFARKGSPAELPKTPEHESNSRRLVEATKSALRGLGYEGQVFRAALAMKSILKNPRQPAPILRRINRRLRDLL